MKQKRKKQWRIVVTGIVVLVIGLGLPVFFNLPKPIEALDKGYDLPHLADGVYAGSCDNGIIQVQVEVTVQDHSITDVRIIHA